MIKSSPSMRLLMVDAENYKIAYAINKHMLDATGQLQKVNQALACEQWHQLKQAFVTAGIDVDVLPSQVDLPDMVFAANQSFPFLHPRTGQKCVLMAQMRSAYRQPEVTFFEKYYQAAGYEIMRLTNTEWAFEGNGDALIHPGKALIWGGYGARTDVKVYQDISNRFGFEVITLQLQNPDYYHLDTCFSLLRDDCVALVPDAFSASDLNKIQQHFKTVIEISNDEGRQNFAGNCFSADGKTVFTQRGAVKFNRDLEGHGFQVVEVDTAEFIKGGGSVFCLKMALPD